MDEPTLGLDQIVRRDLWQVIKMLRERHGVTIVLSTHYLEEAAGVCDRVAIIDHGQIVTQGGPAQLVAELGSEIVELSTDGDGATVRMSLVQLDPRLGRVNQASSTVTVASSEPRHALTERINRLPLRELGVRTIRSAPPR